MTQRPAAGTFTTDGALADQGEKRQALEDMNNAGRELPGGGGVEDLTISGGSITPSRGVVRVDTESAAATDDLDTINVTNHPDGRFLYVMANDDGRTVVLKHNPGGGTGALDLENLGRKDLALNLTRMVALLQRQGSVWKALTFFGREEEHLVGASGEPDYANDWQGTPGTRFQKQPSGITEVWGDLASSTQVSAASVIFTLPAEHFTAGEVSPRVPAIDADGNVHSVYVDTQGEVTFAPGASPLAASTNLYFSRLMARLL